MTRGVKVDKFFLAIVFLLVTIGTAIFISASLGVLAKNAASFRGVLFSQLVLGLCLGLGGMYLASKIDYKLWRKYSFFIFLVGIILTACVFVPGLGWSHGGAQRWISIAGVSFQPVEFLKFGFIVYFAAWLSWARHRVEDFKFGVLPFGIMLLVIAAILFKQPDVKSFILITVTGLGMLFLSGVPFKYLIYSILGAITVLATLVFSMPYLQDRIKTFLDPNLDPRGSSYQIQQAAIAFGSGGLFGRGLGQSVQKFSYLPEPQGDSIFAVLGEEFGFVGVTAVIVLYSLFALRGMRIANRAPDYFSGLLVSGIVILITVQSFMHIAAITGVFPLTGVPLVFMSHGGTSLLIYLIAVGVVLQVSKFQRRI